MTSACRFCVYYMILATLESVIAQSSYATSCGSTYFINITKSQKVNFHGGTKSTTVPPNVSCSWTLVVEREAFLRANDFYLTNEDSFQITDLDSPESGILFGPFHGRQGPFVIAFTKGRFKLDLKTTDENQSRAFLLDIQDSCTADGIYNFISSPRPGTIRSPIYSPRSKGSITCSIQISGYGVSNKPDLLLSLSVVDFNISRGKLALGEIRRPDPIGKYDFVNNMPPPIFLSKTQVLLNLTINTEIPNQFIIMEYEIVSESCSKIVDLTPKNSTAVISLNFHKETVPLPIACQWLVTAPLGHHIHAGSSAINFQHVQDSLVIYGPAGVGFHPVLLTYKSHGLTQMDNITVPANFLMLKFNSPRPQNGLALRLTVSLNGSLPAAREGNGVVTLNELSASVPAYRIHVEDGQYTKLHWETPIPPSSVLLFYKDFNTDSAEAFLELTDNYRTSSLVLPFNKVAVVVQKFFSHSWTFSFEGVTADGCDQIQNGNTILFQSDETCRNTSCSWFVPPRSEEGLFQVSFPKLELGLTGYVSLYKMTDDPETPTATFTPQSNNHILNFPSRSGVRIKYVLDCLHGNSFVEALVLFKLPCNHFQVVSVGESVQVESPRYPEPYPLNSDCQWQLTTQAHYLALRFSQINLSGSNSHLQITSADKTSSVRGLADKTGHYDVLPDDELLEAPVNLRFKASSSSLNIPLSTGFLLTAVAFDCGGVVSNLDGFLNVLPESRFCLWLVSVPRHSYQKTQIHFKIPSRHRSNLKIYDGGSIRSNELSLSRNGIAYSSGSKVMVVYRSDGSAGRRRLLHYVTEYCDRSDTCGTGMCLQPDWRCNGVNDCGDYSDEQGCPVLPTTELYEPLCPNSSSTTRTTATTDIEKADALSPPLSTEGSHHGNAESTSDCRPQSTIAIAVTGSLMLGLVVGTIFGCIAALQFQKRKHWKAVQCVNDGLAADSESL